MSDDNEAPLKLNVSSGPVNLFLTLSKSHLGRCLDKSVIAPFVKAYNKRQHAEESLDTIASVEISGGIANGPVDKSMRSSEAARPTPGPPGRRRHRCRPRRLQECKIRYRTDRREPSPYYAAIQMMPAP